MNVDRKRLAEIVFNNKQKLAALNAIVHPVIMSGIADRLEMLRRTDDVVVLDAALLVELGVVDLLDALIVVTAREDLRKDRLRGRGMRTFDIDARIAAQADQARLLERADIIVTNDGDPQDLVAEADRIWQEIEKRKQH
jgi:dephospho-CoA kinase